MPDTRILQRIYDEVISQGKLEVADELLTPDCVDHETPDAPPGPEGLKQFVAMFRAAFPDLKAVSEDVIAEGDKIVSRFTMTGTHKGELMGVPPTGNKVKIGGIDIVRLENGKVAEHWGYTDQLGLMQQIGAMPA